MGYTKESMVEIPPNDVGETRSFTNLLYCKESPTVRTDNPVSHRESQTRSATHLFDLKADLNFGEGHAE